jgi:hypothetical protein
MSQDSLYYYRPAPRLAKPVTVETDICIYGATSAGIVAAVQAASLKKRVVIVELGHHVGGMTTAGLGAVDIGHKSAIGGLARLFYRGVGDYYETGEVWALEPHVAQLVFEDWLEKYSIPVHSGHALASVERSDGRIAALHTENGASFKAAVFIDASYEGDLMAKAGVSYVCGRESNEVHDENFNGIHFGSPHHNFMRFVDPYKVPGQPASGLLEGVSPDAPGNHGAGDDLIQAFNFRLCLTERADNRVPFPKPPQYNPERYELLRRYIGAGVFDVFNLTLPLPNGKADHNNWGAFNTDNVGASHGWPNGSYAERERIYQDHINYQMGLFWFLANDRRLPERVRHMTAGWGLAADEFGCCGNWPPQLYVREARRMVSDYIVTEHDAFGRFTAEDSVGMASYNMDSHNCKRIVAARRVTNEGNVEIAPIAPFPISYRAIRPKRSECKNLLVPVCVSASHIAFCSIRMESVFMVLAQSAAVAASLAIDEAGGVVQDVSYGRLQSALLGRQQVLQEPMVSPEELAIEGRPLTSGDIPAGSMILRREAEREPRRPVVEGMMSVSE